VSACSTMQGVTNSSPARKADRSMMGHMAR
jgi:hypothetical protein